MSLFIDALSPNDAEEMLRLARMHGYDRWTYSPGANGAVVRDGHYIRAFCLLRELGQGFIIDELWPDNTRDGVHGMKMLADWAERVVQERATGCGCPLTLGGIVRTDNVPHGNALKRRGYTIVAEVLSREFQP
jgi:hypothetical protein